MLPYNPLLPPSKRCSACGATLNAASLHKDSHNRINELESTVRILTLKASAAVDKLADYEDRLQTTFPSSSATRRKTMASLPLASPLAQDHDPMRRKSSDDDPAEPSSSHSAHKALPAIPFSESPEPEAAPSNAARPALTTAARLSSFLSSSSRKSSSPAPDPASQQKHQPASDSISRNEADLLTILSREQTLRHEAEARLENVNTELEELSASLFQQANEMVAEERRARAKLEERAATLEEKVKVLEKRDSEKRKRLERLENAVLRIDKVRTLLGDGLAVPPQQLPPPKYEEV